MVSEITNTRDQNKSSQCDVAEKGSSDCGIHIIAIMTTLAYDDDPVTQRYSQQELRVHLKQCFERGTFLF